MTAEQKTIIAKAKEKYQGKVVKGEQGMFTVQGVWLVYLAGVPRIEVSMSEYGKATTPINISLGKLEREYGIVK